MTEFRLSGTIEEIAAKLRMMGQVNPNATDVEVVEALYVIMRSHEKSGIMEYSCMLCGKLFGDKTTLAKHFDEEKEKMR